MAADVIYGGGEKASKVWDSLLEALLELSDVGTHILLAHRFRYPHYELPFFRKLRKNFKAKHIVQYTSSSRQFVPIDERKLRFAAQGDIWIWQLEMIDKKSEL